MDRPLLLLPARHSHSQRSHSATGSLVRSCNSLQHIQPCHSTDCDPSILRGCKRYRSSLGRVSVCQRSRPQSCWVCWGATDCQCNREDILNRRPTRNRCMRLYTCCPTTVNSSSRSRDRGRDDQSQCRSNSFWWIHRKARIQLPASNQGSNMTARCRRERSSREL